MDWTQTLTIIGTIVPTTLGAVFFYMHRIEDKLTDVISKIDIKIDTIDNRHREDIKLIRADMQKIDEKFTKATQRMDEKWERLFERMFTKDLNKV